MEIIFEELQNHDMNTIEELHELFPHWRRQSILKKIKETEKGKDLRFVGKIDGQIIAHLKISYGKGLHKHRAELTSMIVTPVHRHKGIGKKLATFSLKKLPAKIKLVILAVEKGNKNAIKLYKKLGFKKYGFLKKASILQGKYVDNVLMSKEM